MTKLARARRKRAKRFNRGKEKLSVIMAVIYELHFRVISTRTKEFPFPSIASAAAEEFIDAFWRERGSAELGFSEIVFPGSDGVDVEEGLLLLRAWSEKCAPFESVGGIAIGGDFPDDLSECWLVGVEIPLLGEPIAGSGGIGFEPGGEGGI